jgi:hypothetical protein
MSSAAGEFVVHDASVVDGYASVGTYVGDFGFNGYDVAITADDVAIISWESSNVDGYYMGDSPSFTPLAGASAPTFRGATTYGHGMGWLTGNGTYRMEWTGAGNSPLRSVWVIVCAKGAAQSL